MPEDDFPTGEYPDVTTISGLCQAIDHVRDLGLQGFAELKAERDKAIRERDEARQERDDLRARVQWAGGAL